MKSDSNAFCSLFLQAVAHYITSHRKPSWHLLAAGPVVHTRTISLVGKLHEDTKACKQTKPYLYSSRDNEEMEVYRIYQPACSSL